jgi:ABC-2 type transport system ATP-binding protein
MSKIIEVSSLIKKFGGFTAVNDISFSVEQGDIFAFLGPNGAGKTTTIRMLTTLLHPTTGLIKLNGINVVHDPAGARRSFGIVFQDPSLDNELTARENLEFHAALYDVPRGEARSRIEKLLELVELADRQASYVKTFSGGMKRRLEIARGLLHEPAVLFLDEPTIGLDPQTRAKLWAYIRQANKENGLTVFFTTHHLEEAERSAQTISIIDHGKIVVTGTLAEVKKKAGGATLEEAFLSLTGHSLRADEASSIDTMRMAAKSWGQR